LSFWVRRGELRRFCIIVICLLIFLFVYHTKLKLYSQGAGHHLNPSASVKLRLEANSSKTFIPPVIIFWFAAAVTFYLLLNGQPLEQRVFSSLVSHDATLYYQRRFLRPPPGYSA